MSHVSAQVAVYPLGAESVGPAVSAVRESFVRRGLSPEVGPMSTVVTGELALVLQAVHDAFSETAEHGRVVMTITLSNACPTRS
jgi:uncharacterized protein YqgV (UPF0045/DUF77 family)